MNRISKHPSISLQAMWNNVHLNSSDRCIKDKPRLHTFHLRFILRNDLLVFLNPRLRHFSWGINVESSDMLSLRASHCHSLQLFPFFLTSYSQKVSFNVTSAGKSWYVPLQKEAAESTPGTPALSQIRSLAFRWAAGLGERLLLLAQDLPSEVIEENTIPIYKKRFGYERCGVVFVPMPFMWSSGPHALKGRVEMA